MCLLFNIQKEYLDLFLELFDFSAGVLFVECQLVVEFGSENSKFRCFIF